MRLRLTLQQTDSSDTPSTYVFEQEEVTIGRSSENDLTLEDPTSVVSKRHARLRAIHGRVEVEDLGSKNFTFVNGQRLMANQPRAVSAGDKIEIGTYQMAVGVEQGPARDLEQTVFAAGFANPFSEAADSFGVAFGQLRRTIATSSYPRSDEALLDALRESMGPGEETEALHAVLLGHPPPSGPQPPAAEVRPVWPTNQPADQSSESDPFALSRPQRGPERAEGKSAEEDPFAHPPSSGAQPSPGPSDPFRRPDHDDPFAASPGSGARSDPFDLPPGRSASDDPFAVPPPKPPATDPFAAPRGTPSVDPFSAAATGRAHDDPFAFSPPQKPGRPSSAPTSPTAGGDSELVDRLLGVVTRLIGIPWQFRHEFVGHTILHTPETAFLYDGDPRALRAYLTEGPERAERLRMLEEAAEQVVLHQVAMLEGYRAAAEAGVSRLLDAVDPEQMKEQEGEKGVGKFLASIKGGGGSDRTREKVAELRSESVSVVERRFFRPAFIDAYLSRLSQGRG